MSAQKLYDQILNLLRAKYGTQEQWSSDIDTIMRSLFGNKACKTVPFDLYEPNKNNSYCVINTDSSKQKGAHWVSIYKKNNNLYVYDSFGRKTSNILKKFYKKMKVLGYKIIESKNDPEQKTSQKDCGLRCISFLLVVKFKGIDEALTI